MRNAARCSRSHSDWLPESPGGSNIPGCLVSTTASRRVSPLPISDPCILREILAGEIFLNFSRHPIYRTTGVLDSQDCDFFADCPACLSSVRASGAGRAGCTAARFAGPLEWGVVPRSPMVSQFVSGRRRPPTRESIERHGARGPAGGSLFASPRKPRRPSHGKPNREFWSCAFHAPPQ